MYYIYIIRNNKGRYYIGATSDITARLRKHDMNGSQWTKLKGPWQLVYKEELADKQQALQREHVIKSYKGGNAFKNLMRRGARAV